MISKGLMSPTLCTNFLLGFEETQGRCGQSANYWRVVEMVFILLMILALFVVTTVLKTKEIIVFLLLFLARFLYV